MPQLPVHSTVMSCGQVIAGGGLEACVDTFAVLLSGSGSGRVAAMVAELAIVVWSATEQSTLPTSVKTPVDPVAMSERVQATVPLAETAGVVQDQPGGDASDSNPTLAGRMSVRVIVPLGFGPLLPTPIV